MPEESRYLPPQYNNQNMPMHNGNGITMSPEGGHLRQQMQYNAQQPIQPQQQQTMQPMQAQYNQPIPQQIQPQQQQPMQPMQAQYNQPIPQQQNMNYNNYNQYPNNQMNPNMNNNINYNNYNNYDNNIQNQNQNMNQNLNQPQNFNNNIYGPSNNGSGLSNQTIQIEVKVDGNNNQIAKPLPVTKPYPQQQSKRKPIEPKTKCCKCIGVFWVFYIVLYIGSGLFFFIGYDKRTEIAFISFGVLSIIDCFFVRKADPHNTICDCSSEPIDDGRTKACMLSLIMQLIFMICGLIFYYNQDSNWGYITFGAWAIGLLSAMYAASEKSDD